MSHKRFRRGSALLYLAIALPTFTGFVALGVDVAHARMVKIQLQGAADAAARAAAQNLKSGTATAQSYAISVAASNKADGAPVVINANDIEFGSWDGSAFVPLTGAAQASADAVRIRCERSAARGNAVATIFGSMLNLFNRDVTARSTTTGRSTFVAGFIGYAGVTAKNVTFFGGYNSNVTTAPSESSADSKMRVGSNSFINGKNVDDIYGDAILGPSASLTGFTVHGSSTPQTSDIPLPTMPNWNPQTNPNNVSPNYVTTNNITLPGGTYYFNSMDIEADLTFSGPATIYVNGPVTFGGTIKPASGVPTELTIYQLAASTFGDSTANGMDVTARVIAPYSDFVSKNKLTFKGSGIFNTILSKNAADFFYDEAQGPSDGSNAVVTVD